MMNVVAESVARGIAAANSSNYSTIADDASEITDTSTPPRSFVQAAAGSTGNAFKRRKDANA
eukprot:4788940-Ditylum_brightwellii.AAC.1